MAAIESSANFDYSAFDKDTKGKLIALTGQWKRYLKTHLDSAVELGGVLAEAQEILAGRRTGMFIEWATLEFGIAKPTIYKYLAAYGVRKQLSTAVDNSLSLTALANLGSKSTPPAALKKVAKLAQKGRVTEQAVKRIIAESKPKATDFDPATVAAKPAKPEKPKAGQPTVPSKLRAQAVSELDKLGRTLTRLGIYDEFIRPLSQLRERIKSL